MLHLLKRLHIIYILKELNSMAGETFSGPEGQFVPHIELNPGTPEYRQRFAQLACEAMADAMRERIERQPGFSPATYAGDQIVTMQAAVFYLQGPYRAGESGEPQQPSSASVKVHTHPPADRIEDSREFTYDKGRAGAPPLVTVQRGFGFPDPNLTETEMAFLQTAVVDVRRAAALDED